MSWLTASKEDANSAMLRLPLPAVFILVVVLNVLHVGTHFTVVYCRFRETVRRGSGRRAFDDDCHYVGEGYSLLLLATEGLVFHRARSLTCNIMADSKLFSGEFKGGELHGKGSYTFNDGST